MKRIIHVLSGCTAVGKTEWALRWAEARDAEIISCDSLLFYRGMDIGTAKPTRAERVRVPHHLVDILDMTGRMDVATYARLAREVAAEIVARGRAVIVTGGSGFYLKTFIAPVTDDVAVPAEVRARVATLGLSEAVEELAQLNPGGLGKLDVANPRRVQRALERCVASGKTLTTLAIEFGARPAPFADWEIKLARLDRSPGELEQRVAQRVDVMLKEGLIEEVERLLGAGLRENPSAAKAIGYREVIAMLDGNLPPAALAGEIARNTRALVKKQRTWFRTQLPSHRVLSAEDATVEGLFAGD